MKDATQHPERVECVLRLMDTIMMAQLTGLKEEDLMERAHKLSELSLYEPIHLTQPKKCHEFYAVMREIYRRKGQKFPFNFVEDFIKNGRTMKPPET